MYLQELKQQEVHPDHITLQAVANVCHVKFTILASQVGSYTIAPFPPAVAGAEIALAHIASNRFHAIKPGVTCSMYFDSTMLNPERVSFAVY